jgi:glycosyltransferase involved in cell wall biosynthesis
VIAVGDNIAVQVERLGVPKDRITVTHSGIWCERYRSSDERAAVRRELDITDDEFVIVNLARLHALKGQTYLIDALSTLSESMSATLVVVGDGPERETLEAQSNACGARVVFVGDQPHDQVPRYLAAADIFALTSVSLPGQQEGFNTSIKEAMAAGLPIVSTTTGSIPSYVIEPDNGVLVPERDGEAIATAIKRLASSRDLRLTIGATNKYQAQSYDWSVVSKEMDKAYERAGAVQ